MGLVLHLPIELLLVLYLKRIIVKILLRFLHALYLDFCNRFLGVELVELEVFKVVFAGVPGFCAIRLLNILVAHRIDPWRRDDLLIFK